MTSSFYHPNLFSLDFYPDDSLFDNPTEINSGSPHLSAHIHSVLEAAITDSEGLGHYIGGVVQLRPQLRFSSSILSGHVNTSNKSEVQISSVPRLCGGCVNCGARFVVDLEIARHSTSISPAWGMALTSPCVPEPLRAIETYAFLQGESYTALSTLLQAEIENLSPQQQERFDPGEYDYLHQRWISDDGLIALQWSLRDFPALPIGEDNRQGKDGIVGRVRLTPKEELLPVFYAGPRLNPNESEEEEEWLTVPLETGEPGFAYRDALGRWRFKREVGTVGFFISPEHFSSVPPLLHFPSATPSHDFDIRDESTNGTLDSGIASPNDFLTYP